MIKKHTRFDGLTMRDQHYNPIAWNKVKKLGAKLALLAEETSESVLECPVALLCLEFPEILEITEFEMTTAQKIAFYYACRKAYRTKQSTMYLPVIGKNEFEPIQLHLSFFQLEARQAFYEMIFIFDELGRKIVMHRTGGHEDGQDVSFGCRDGLTPYSQILNGLIKPTKK